MNVKRLIRNCVAVCIAVGLSACSAPASVPVVERGQPPSEAINHHWVAEGETLYAIAWRYNMDYRQLAAANGLSAPYSIRKGQRLSLVLGKTPAVPAPTSGGITRLKSHTSAKTGQASAERPATDSAEKTLSWQWPAKGKVSRSFGTGHRVTGQGSHKGIDIAGQSGQAVTAASSGTVVYAGDGLPAYGNLLIVKHNDLYLSAYAHNRRLLVGEGDRVRSGQKIAEMGRSGTTHEHLHFEIRRNGRPVDPLGLLASR